MLLKSRDEKADDRKNVRRMAGSKAEQDAAYLIDFHFAQSENWIVIHDLRIEANGRTAQIDHILISRFLEVYVLESKSFRSGLTISDQGDFTTWHGNKPTGIESPLEQNRRHIIVLRDVLQPLLPSRMGLRLSPVFKSLVLLSSTSTFKRPEKFDTSDIIKADALRTRIDRDVKSESMVANAASVLRVVSSDTLHQLGMSLVRLHTPVANAPRGAIPSEDQVIPPVAGSEPPSNGAAHRCKHCTSDNLRIEYGRNYYFKCRDCQGNTSIPLAAGTKLRKSGSDFYLATPSGESLFFVNREHPIASEAQTTITGTEAQT